MFKGGGDGFLRVAIFAEIEIEHFEGLGRGVDECVKSPAGSFGALNEGAEADAIRHRGQGEERFGDFDVIVSDVGENGEGRAASCIELDGHSSCRMSFVPLNVVEGHAVRANEVGGALAAIVFAEAGDEPTFMTEAVDAIGEIGGRTTEDFTGGEDVPEEFSERDDGFGHI